MLRCDARDMQRVPRSQTRFRVAIPRVNPGSEPVQPPRLAGVWTVLRWRTHFETHNTYDHVACVWLRVAGEWKVQTASPMRWLDDSAQLV